MLEIKSQLLTWVGSYSKIQVWAPSKSLNITDSEWASVEHVLGLIPSFDTFWLCHELSSQHGVIYWVGHWPYGMFQSLHVNRKKKRKSSISLTISMFDILNFNVCSNTKKSSKIQTYIESWYIKIDSWQYEPVKLHFVPIHFRYPKTLCSIAHELLSWS